jgi:hypothetical protein
MKYGGYHWLYTWQGKAKTRTFSQLTFHADLRAMSFNNGLDDCQTQAIAFDVLDRFITDTVKTIEDEW